MRTLATCSAEKLVVVACTTVDAITQNKTPVKDAAGRWTLSLGLSKFDQINKLLEHSNQEILNKSSTLIFAGNNDDELNKSIIHDSIRQGKHRSKPSIALRSIGIGTYDRLFEMLGNNPKVYNVLSTCTSGISALELAFLLSIQYNDLVTIVTNSDNLHGHVLHIFDSIGAISKSNTYHGPFSIDASGLCLSDGAALLQVCTESLAKKLKLEPIAIIDDVFTVTQPGHLTKPTTDGLIEEAIKYSLRNKNISFNDVGWWSAHATATPVGDKFEYELFNSIVGTSDVLISSLKGAVGHSLSSSSLLELAISINIFKDGLTPGNKLLYTTLHNDPRILLSDVQTNKKTFIKTGFGFGGNNGFVVVTVI